MIETKLYIPYKQVIIKYMAIKKHTVKTPTV